MKTFRNDTCISRGISLVEILGAMFIMGLIVSWGVKVFADFLARQTLNAAVEHVVGVVEQARSFALAGREGTGLEPRHFGVVFQSASDQFYIYSSNKDCSFVSLEIPGVVEGLTGDVDLVSAEFEDTAMTQISNSILFVGPIGDVKMHTVDYCAPLAPASAGIILKSRRSGEERKIKVSSTGVIEIQ
jgi:hypothetical protein